MHAHLDDEPDPRGGGDGPARSDLPPEAAACLMRAATAAARHRGFRSGRIEIAVVDDAQIRQVNRQHLDHDWETDVISFPYRCDGEEVEGELIVSWETACREAAATRWPPLTELALYVIHGTLHLTGMDDRDRLARQEMREAECELVASLGLAGAERYDVATEEER